MVVDFRVTKSAAFSPRREKKDLEKLPSARVLALMIKTAMGSSCAFYLFIRVMEITDILSQNVPLEDVQYLAGHSNPSGHTDL